MTRRNTEIVLYIAGVELGEEIPRRYCRSEVSLVLSATVRVGSSSHEVLDVINQTSSSHPTGAFSEHLYICELWVVFALVA